ncbi:uncharacterized protein LOC114727587 [Neltuma alba]|uniref:uncharacterized protein LOC114727587 n=1 Tax=Neltuma alba TaxID=207710 RepID=UPI0010A50DED|nr:uncharacterized protein LOC114727587 [Prosopis alba]
MESGECIKVCGLDPKALGISSDALFDSHSTHNLCSPHCYYNCSNVVDFYCNITPQAKLREVEGASAQPAMAELRSSRIVVPGPVKSAATAETPQSQPHNSLLFCCQPIGRFSTMRQLVIYMFLLLTVCTKPYINRYYIMYRVSLST